MNSPKTVRTPSPQRMRIALPPMSQNIQKPTSTPKTATLIQERRVLWSHEVPISKARAHAVAAADADRAAANVAEYPEADIDPKNCDIDPGAARPLEPRGSALHSRLRDAARRGHRLGFAVYAGPSHRAFAFADRGF